MNYLHKKGREMNFIYYKAHTLNVKIYDIIQKWR